MSLVHCVMQGDALAALTTLPDESVQCCITSPPYFGLRDYGTAEWLGGDAACNHEAARSRAGFDYALSGKQRSSAGTDVKAYQRECPCGAVRMDRQIGLEPTPDEYVAALVAVFREVRRVLRKDGTVFLNLGDSYAASGMGFGGGKKQRSNTGSNVGKPRTPPSGYKQKDLLGIPWRVAFALQADGWWLRSDIIWAKTAPMPESVTDRPTRSHEYVFLLAKSERYFYDADAIKEPMAPESAAHYEYGFGGAKNVHLKTADKPTAVVGSRDAATGRNKRDVWLLNPEPYAAAHFATMPTALVKPCVLAGSRYGDTVLDPFLGSGTTLAVAKSLGRSGVGIELNAEYITLAHRRIDAVTLPLPLFQEGEGV